MNLYQMKEYAKEIETTEQNTQEKKYEEFSKTKTQAGSAVSKTGGFKSICTNNIVMQKQFGFGFGFKREPVQFT